MLTKTPRNLCSGLTLCLAAGSLASAQCSTCPQPVVAYSPVVAQAPPQTVLQPVANTVVVPQAAPTYTGWYPGKWIGNLFRPRPVQPAAVVAPQPTFVTAAYRPTFPPSYTQFASAPMAQTVARPVVLAPAQPMAATSYYGSPCATAMPVTAASPSCGVCGGGVAPATFNAPVDTGCSSCAGGGGVYSNSGSVYNGGGYTPPAQPQQPQADFNRPLEPTPAPAIPPGADVSPERRLRPESPADVAPPAKVEPTDGVDDEMSWWNPPPFNDGRDRSANRGSGQPSNVRNALYRSRPTARPTGISETAYRPRVQPSQPRRLQVGTSGWTAAE